VFTIVVTGGYLVYTVLKSVRARARGLSHDSLQLVLVRGGIIVAIGVSSPRSPTGTATPTRSRSSTGCPGRWSSRSC